MRHHHNSCAFSSFSYHSSIFAIHECMILFVCSIHRAHRVACRRTAASTLPPVVACRTRHHFILYLRNWSNSFISILILLYKFPPRSHITWSAPLYVCVGSVHKNASTSLSLSLSLVCLFTRIFVFIQVEWLRGVAHQISSLVRLGHSALAFGNGIDAVCHWIIYLMRIRSRRKLITKRGNFIFSVRP